MEYIIILSIFMWLLTGWLSFVFWWTKEFDFTVKDLSASFFIALCGPLVWVIGYFKFAKEGKILIKKKGESWDG